MHIQLVPPTATFAPAPNRGHGDGLGIFLSWGWVSNMITPSENTGSIILLVSKSREVIPMGIIVTNIIGDYYTQ